jgi:hypothetical protein
MSESQDPILALPLFPVYFYEKGKKLPENGIYYVIAENGIFVKVQHAVGEGLVKAEGIPWLEKVTPEVKMTLPQIPARIIKQAHTFFRKVWDKYQSESYVQLYYSQELNQYRLHCPAQTVSFSSVNYDRADQFSYEERAGSASTDINKSLRWTMAGTIHSHCNFSAFHSGTDTGDEETFDGIHITLGHVNRDEFSMVASVAINGNRTQLDPLNCVIGISNVENTNHNNFKKTNSNFHSSFMMNSTRVDQFFSLTLSEEESKNVNSDAEMIEVEWMPKVNKEAPQNFLGVGKSNYSQYYSKSYFKGNNSHHFFDSDDADSDDADSDDADSDDADSDDAEYRHFFDSDDADSDDADSDDAD